MSADELVSVVIPTYDRAASVAGAIDSALGQTHRRLEVVVVDDGSSDDTADVLARRYGSEPRVVYRRQENRGVAAARNAGLRLTRGSYVALLDSDDEWKPWKLALQLRCLERYPEAGMIWTDMEAIGPDGRVVSPRFLRTMYRASYRWFPTPESLFTESAALEELGWELPAAEAGRRVYLGDLSSSIVMGNLVHTSTVLLKRSRLEQVGAFDEGLRVGEDFGFHLRTCRAGPVAFADVASIRYRVGAEDQLTRPELQVEMARAFLDTIGPLLGDGQREVALPPRMVEAVLAEAHAWVGRESLAHGDRREARSQLARSLRHRALVPSTLLLLALACGPESAFPAARSVVRTAKRAMRRCR